MLESILAIERYTEGMSQRAILESSLHKDAIVRNLEVLGEAANQLTKEIHLLAPNIPWVQIISLRNRLIHEYHGVNWKVIIPIIVKELPTLKEKLQTLQNSLPKIIN
jgi:uncharacterized protein with HEPN domain